MKTWFYYSEEEFESEAKLNEWKIIDFGGNRQKYVSALIETKEGKLASLLIMRTKTKWEVQ